PFNAETRTQSSNAGAWLQAPGRRPPSSQSSTMRFSAFTGTIRCDARTSAAVGRTPPAVTLDPVTRAGFEPLIRLVLPTRAESAFLAALAALTGQCNRG